MKIFILDDDLGFLFWIAKVLQPFGYQVIPADTVAKANKLIRQLKLSINLVMVNPAVAGAVEFVESLRERERTHLKVAALVSEADLHSKHADLRADAARAKPDPQDLAELTGAPDVGQHPLESEWVRFVQQVLGQRTAGSRAN